MLRPVQVPIWRREEHYRKAPLSGQECGRLRFSDALMAFSRGYTRINGSRGSWGAYCDCTLSPGLKRTYVHSLSMLGIQVALRLEA